MTHNFWLRKVKIILALEKLVDPVPARSDASFSRYKSEVLSICVAQTALRLADFSAVSLRSILKVEL